MSSAKFQASSDRYHKLTQKNEALRQSGEVAGVLWMRDMLFNGGLCVKVMLLN